MATYTADFMKRIAFLDGQVLHDFHLNRMQKNIAEAIKQLNTRERYDIYLLVSPYNEYFHETFIDDADRDPASTAVVNTLQYSINQGVWESTMLSLPQTTNEINLVSNFEDYPNKGANVNFYYRTSRSNPWVPIMPDQPAYLSSPSRYFQIKIECLYTGTIRPAVYDYALMWK